MIVGNRAYLIVRSEVLTVAEISHLLGLSPSDAADIGELTPAGRSARDVRSDLRRHQVTHWTLRVSDEGKGDDATGFAALRLLADALVPRAAELAAIREHGETFLTWYGDSDSEQGGFVLPIDLIADLAQLGCSIWGTAFLTDDTDDAASD